MGNEIRSLESVQSNNDVLVSIKCITYNHEPYIRQALDSFLMQKTNFRFEIVIHDDASTDKTQEIIKEYQKAYPDIIVPILQKENQYSKRVDLDKFISPLLRGRYVALCEGDDYWTDPQKLQIQFDYMEKNPECSIFIHNIFFLNEQDPQKKLVKNQVNVPTGDYNLGDFLEFVMEKRTIGGTATYFYRKSMMPKNMYAEHFSFGDFFSLLGLRSGYMHYLDECMSVYRGGHTGSYNSVRNELPFLLRNEQWENYWLEMIIASEYMNLQMGYQYDKEFKRFQKWILKDPMFSLFRTDIYYKDSFLENVYGKLRYNRYLLFLYGLLKRCRLMLYK